MHGTVESPDATALSGGGGTPRIFSAIFTHRAMMGDCSNATRFSSRFARIGSMRMRPQVWQEIASLLKNASNDKIEQDEFG